MDAANIFLVILATAMAFCIWMLVRNNAWHDFQQAKLERLTLAAIKDAEAGRDWNWRYAKFRAIDYNLYVQRPFTQFESLVDWSFVEANVEVTEA